MYIYMYKERETRYIRVYIESPDLWNTPYLFDIMSSESSGVSVSSTFIETPSVLCSGFWVQSFRFQVQR